VSDGGEALRPVIVQDVDSGAVLMLAWANAAAVRHTRERGRAHFWSRSREALWDKGATSGQVLTVRRILTDCDEDAWLYQVQAPRGACHLGRRSCFGDQAEVPVGMLGRLFQIQKERLERGPASSYTRRLAEAGPDRVLRKVGEEAAEFLLACKNDDADEVTREAADLIYHLWLALHVAGVDLDAVAGELSRRHQAAGSDPGGCARSSHV